MYCSNSGNAHLAFDTFKQMQCAATEHLRDQFCATVTETALFRWTNWFSRMKVAGWQMSSSLSGD